MSGLKLRNGDGTELLTLTRHPGSSKGMFDEARVEESDPGKNRAPLASFARGRFSTGRGITLGISQEKVIDLLGDPHDATREEGVDVLTYKTRGEGAKVLLKHFNTPAYTGRYRFRSGKLVAFEFGFDYM